MLPSLGGRAECVSAHAGGVLTEFMPSQEGQRLVGATNFIFAVNVKRVPPSDFKLVRAWPPATFSDPAGIDGNVQCMLGVFQKLSRR